MGFWTTRGSIAPWRRSRGPPLDACIKSLLLDVCRMARILLLCEIDQDTRRGKLRVSPIVLMDQDPFEDLFSLEDNLYNEGYRQGVADGSHAGHLEGRAFGVEKGFEKYLAMGRLQGRTAIWLARSRPDDSKSSLPPLPARARLAKHLAALQDMVASHTLSTENSEDSVSDFDDRLRRANAKIKIIGRILGEDGLNQSLSVDKATGGKTPQDGSRDNDRDGEGNIEDIRAVNARR